MHPPWEPRPCASRLTSLNQSNRVRPVSTLHAKTRPSSTHSLEGATDQNYFCGAKELEKKNSSINELQLVFIEKLIIVIIME